VSVEEPGAKPKLKWSHATLLTGKGRIRRSRARAGMGNDANSRLINILFSEFINQRHDLILKTQWSHLRRGPLHLVSEILSLPWARGPLRVSEEWLVAVEKVFRPLRYDTDSGGSI